MTAELADDYYHVVHAPRNAHIRAIFKISMSQAEQTSKMLDLRDKWGAYRSLTKRARQINAAAGCPDHDDYDPQLVLNLVDGDVILGKHRKLSDDVLVIDLVGHEETLVVSRGKASRMQGTLKHNLRRPWVLEARAASMINDPVGVST